MINSVRSNWNNGKAAINGWLTIPSSVTAEILAGESFDALTIDMQHGLIGYETALAMLQALRSSRVTPIVRVPSLDTGMIAKVLDAGSVGVICPMIDTVEQAKELVRSCRYPPVGGRSFGPTRARLVHGPSYISNANNQVIVFAMIETERACKNLDAIAQVPGLDGLYIGPSDLSLSFGGPPTFDSTAPDMADRILSIQQSAHNHGIRAGIHCASTGYALQMIAKGFDFVTVGSDWRWISSGAEVAAGEMENALAGGNANGNSR